MNLWVEIAELTALAIVAIFIAWRFAFSINELLETLRLQNNRPEPPLEPPPRSAVPEAPAAPEAFARLEYLLEAQHRETLAHIDRARKTLTDGLREILVRDFSRTATQFPRLLRIDLGGSGIQSTGKVQGGEFLANLDKVRFQLICESSNCDGKGQRFLSQSVYEVPHPSYFSGTLRKVTGGADPALVLFDSVNRFDDLTGSAFAEGVRIALHVTVNIALTPPLSATAVVELDSAVSAVLDKIKRGAARPEDRSGLWQIISQSDFSVRDLGGTAHTQFGVMMQRQDEQRNQTLFGGLTRILDADKGYIWVCPAHAQGFMDSLRSR